MIKILIIVSLFLILFIDGLGISIVLPLFSDMFLIGNSKRSLLLPEASMAMRNFMYGFSLIVFSIGMFFGAPILGELSDKYGRKKILVSSLIGTFIGYVISGLGIVYKSPSLFIIGRAIDGITCGTIPIAQAIIADITPKGKEVGNMGLILFAVTAGYFVGPILANLLTQNDSIFGENLSFPFFIAALLSLISLLFLMLFKETFSIKKQNLVKVNWLSSLNIFSYVKEVLNIKSLLIAFLFFQLGWIMYFQYLPYTLAASGNEKLITYVLTVVGAGMCISFCILTSILQRFLKPLQMVSISLCFIFVGLAGQLGISSYIIILLSAFISSLGYGVGYSALMGYIVQRVSPDLRGGIMGVSASLSALSSVVTALIGIFTVYISFYFPYIFAFFCFLVAFIYVLAENLYLIKSGRTS